MSTGISGSKTVLRASTIPFSTSEGSVEMAVAVGWVASWSIASSILFRGHGLILLFQSRQQGMPHQGGALDAHRKLAHAAEDGELAELRRPLAGSRGDQRVEILEQGAGRFDGAALERLRHQRGRRGRDGAAGALEGDVADAAVLEVEEHGHLVAAERVVPFRLMVRLRQGTEVAGPPVVIEDDLLIELAQLAHANNSRVRWRAAASDSTSSGVLYSAKEARVVAGTPKRSITGCAQ